MLVTQHGLLEYWPVMATAGIGLVAWGEQRVRLARAEKDIKELAPREVVQQGFDNIDKRLDRLSGQLERLLEEKK